MNTYKRYRFPPDIISCAIWLYYRFNLSHRDIEDRLAERGITVSRDSSRSSKLRDSSPFMPLYRTYSIWVGTLSGLNITENLGLVRSVSGGRWWPDIPGLNFYRLHGLICRYPSKIQQRPATLDVGPDKVQITIEALPFGCFK
jgi:hypothetical protein